MRIFLKSKGKSLILSKSVKSQGIIFFDSQFIVFLEDCEMHFFFFAEKDNKYVVIKAINF